MPGEREVLGGNPRGWGCRRGRRDKSDSRFCFSFCFMSDLCAHGQSLLIWVFFEDPQGELTRNVYDDDDESMPIISLSNFKNIYESSYESTDIIF